MNQKYMYINTFLAGIILVTILLIYLAPLPYCDENMKTNCRKCPKGAKCSGLTIECPFGYVSNGVECVHTTAYKTAYDSIKEKATTLLRKQMGDFQCSNLTDNGVKHAFITRVQLEKALHMNSSNPDYVIFEEVVKSLPCYSVVRSDDDLLSAPTSSPLDFKKYCDYSDINNQYFIIAEDPIITRKCRFYKYLDSHQDIIQFYVNRILGSILIVSAITLIIMMIREYYEIVTEINNILVENCEKPPVEISLIRSEILRTGNHRVLSYFVWKIIPSMYKKRKDVSVLVKQCGDKYIPCWKWKGTSRIIKKCSRRPYIHDKIDTSNTSVMQEFVSELH